MNPIIHKDIFDFIQSHKYLIGLIENYGSPLHIVFPQIADENAHRWLNKLRQIYHKINIYYAMKACKSPTLMNAFANANIGADVSSIGEASNAFNSMVTTDRMTFTGPHKTENEIRFCLKHGIRINLDSLEETKDFILKHIPYFDSRFKVSLRIQATNHPDSRFGMTRVEILEAANQLFNHGISRLGLSFHLSGYESLNRIEMLISAIELAKKIKRVDQIDIGGGFPLRYTEESLKDYIASSKRCHYSLSNNNFYPYDSELSADNSAEYILKKVLHNKEIKDFLINENLEISLQPGRSILDQCGISIFRVVGKKKTLKPFDLLILEGMNFSISETWFNSDFLPMPILSSDSSYSDNKNKPFVLAGKSCLENDIIRFHAVHFTKIPKNNDLVIFFNTAGYQMDSNESKFHLREIPLKISAHKKNEIWKTHLDKHSCFDKEQYRNDS